MLLRCFSSEISCYCGKHSVMQRASCVHVVVVYCDVVLKAVFRRVACPGDMYLNHRVATHTRTHTHRRTHTFSSLPSLNVTFASVLRHCGGAYPCSFGHTRSTRSITQPRLAFTFNTGYWHRTACYLCLLFDCCVQVRRYKDLTAVSCHCKRYTNAPFLHPSCIRYVNCTHWMVACL
jgi:hypothetical protein